MSAMEMPTFTGSIKDGMLEGLESMILVGKGAFGTIWRVRDSSTRAGDSSTLALKLANIGQNGRCISQGDGKTNEATVSQRLETEARALYAVQGGNGSPHLVQPYALLHAPDKSFLGYFREYVPGYDLSHIVNTSGPIAPATAAKYMIGCADGVGMFHRAGLVTRDIKPANMVVTPEGEVKIIDVSFPVPSNGGTCIHQAGREISFTGLTEDGYIAGTPNYASPEQLAGKPLDPRSDIFSIGTTLYFLLSGKVPFSGKGTSELVQNIMANNHRPLGEMMPVPDSDIRAIVEKCMQPDKEKRYGDIAELRSALEGYLVVHGQQK